MSRLASQLELLAALKQSLDDLETVKTVPQDDPTLLHLKETLRAKIAEMEKSKKAAA